MLIDGGAFVVGISGDMPKRRNWSGVEVRLTKRDGQPWGRTRSLEEPYALIGLVRICGGRRLTTGSSGPIPETSVLLRVRIFPTWRPAAERIDSEPMQTTPLPEARPRSDRFRCGGRESKSRTDPLHQPSFLPLAELSLAPHARQP